MHRLRLELEGHDADAMRDMGKAIFAELNRHLQYFGTPLGSGPVVFTRDLMPYRGVVAVSIDEPPQFEHLKHGEVREYDRVLPLCGKDYRAKFCRGSSHFFVDQKDECMCGEETWAS